MPYGGHLSGRRNHALLSNRRRPIGGHQSRLEPVRHERSKTDVAWINDDFLPSVKTGEGLSHSSPEALAAGLLRHAAAGVESLPGEFDHSIEGANRLGYELEQARQREIEEHGPVIVHDGFTDPE